MDGLDDGQLDGTNTACVTRRETKKERREK
jgi:hypothetical protein